MRLENEFLLDTSFPIFLDVGLRGPDFLSTFHFRYERNVVDFKIIKNVISLIPESIGSKNFQTITIPSFPRKGDRWTYPVSGEELTWYIDANGISAFVEFADGAIWINMSASLSALILPENPTQNQVLIHGQRKWTWNGKFWKAFYARQLLAGTFID